MIPYARPKLSDFYTLCQTKLLENHTLHSGTYLYRSHKGVPPTPPPNPGDILAECVLLDDEPQSLRAFITTENGDCLYNNAVSLAIATERSTGAFQEERVSISQSMQRQKKTCINKQQATSPALKKNHFNID